MPGGGAREAGEPRGGRGGRLGGDPRRGCPCAGSGPCTSVGDGAHLSARRRVGLGPGGGRRTASAAVTSPPGAPQPPAVGGSTAGSASAGPASREAPSQRPLPLRPARTGVGSWLEPGRPLQRPVCGRQALAVRAVAVPLGAPRRGPAPQPRRCDPTSNQARLGSAHPAGRRGLVLAGGCGEGWGGSGSRAPAGRRFPPLAFSAPESRARGLCDPLSEARSILTPEGSRADMAPLGGLLLGLTNPSSMSFTHSPLSFLSRVELKMD